MNVVLVHGFADTGRLFRALSRNLAAQGHACHTPTLHPRDARLGIPDLSGKLAAFIDEAVAPGQPVALVGFSMGALVARHCLQGIRGRVDVRAFFSIAGPHRGTVSAYLYPGAGTRQMRHRSLFLRELDETGSLAGLSLFTYRTPFDLMVNPAGTTRLPSATEVVVLCPFHSMLPSSAGVMSHIAGALARLDSQAARTRA
jgi:triacylglycerol lipase